MSGANNKQVGGDHYRGTGDIQHWDYAYWFRMGYLEGCATAYVSRCRKKRTFKEDLEKAHHFVEKMIEVGARPTATKADRTGLLDRFCASQGLNDMEKRIILLLTRWNGHDDLRQALSMLQTYIGHADRVEKEGGLHAIIK